MKLSKLYVLLAVLMSFAIVSCSDDDDNNKLKLDITGLENLGDDFQYEGWIIVDGNAVTTGVFTVDDNGNMSETSFELDEDQLEKASTFVLTIEPKPDSDPSPSNVHILAGDFSDDKASLTIDHSAALGHDFSTASGKYILATPTDGGADDNEESGIWFLDNSSGSAQPGLMLPTLPDGWIYEGWAVVDGTPVTTGTFSAADMADNAAPYSGMTAGPPFPGEDLLKDAPSGLTFPTDLRGGKAVISIEPVPDNSSMPFTLKPLAVDIASDAMLHTAYEISNNNAKSAVSGTAKK